MWFSVLCSSCRQLDWRPEKQGEIRKRHEKVVIIRNMFHPSDFEVQKKKDSHSHTSISSHSVWCKTVIWVCLFQEDPLVLNEYREDLRSECEKFGEVKKVILFDVSLMNPTIKLWINSAIKKKSEACWFLFVCPAETP